MSLTGNVASTVVSKRKHHKTEERHSSKCYVMLTFCTKLQIHQIVISFRKGTVGRAARLTQKQNNKGPGWERINNKVTVIKDREIRNDQV